MIRTLVQDYEHMHTTIGISGNLLFVVGSVLFYKAFAQYHTLAVTMFVVGSTFMLIGSVGNGLRRMWQRREESHPDRSTTAWRRSRQPTCSSSR